MTRQDEERTIDRRYVLKTMAASVGCALASRGMAFARDRWRKASIAATGFGLTALCIVNRRAMQLPRCL